MKKLIPLAWFALACIAAPAENTAPQPLSTVNFRGEELPVFAASQPIQPKKLVQPQYPARERLAGLDGQAVITLLVGADGKVSEVDILSSQPTAFFGKAARAAALQWQYEPLVQEGQPTAFIVQQPVTFRIEGFEVVLEKPIPARWR